MSLAPLINVSYVKNLTTGYKKYKNAFLSEFLGLNIAYRTRKWLSKLLTGQEFGAQNRYFLQQVVRIFT